MSIIDKAVAAMSSPESEQDRLEATSKARAAAEPGDWLSVALDHHDMIREAFATAASAQTADDQIAALKSLAAVLNGHSLAEEVVLYPALAKAHEKGHAMSAYTQQTTAKMEMAELERLQPGSSDWSEQLHKIQEAVLHHIYEEEGNWFIDLKESAPEQAFLTKRFKEEFQRYADGAGLETRTIG